jgi:hypothetical protein
MSLSPLGPTELATLIALRTEKCSAGSKSADDVMRDCSLGLRLHLLPFLCSSADCASLTPASRLKERALVRLATRGKDRLGQILGKFRTRC